MVATFTVIAVVLLQEAPHLRSTGILEASMTLLVKSSSSSCSFFLSYSFDVMIDRA